MIICLIGNAGSGKDEVGRILCEEHGFTRVAPGDYIKDDLSELGEWAGFNPHTDHGEEKERIRPLLESLPGAPGVIYLDFDGETVTDGRWNSGQTIHAPPPAGLDADEIRGTVR